MEQFFVPEPPAVDPTAPRLLITVIVPVGEPVNVMLFDAPFAHCPVKVPVLKVIGDGEMT